MNKIILAMTLGVCLIAGYSTLLVEIVEAVVPQDTEEEFKQAVLKADDAFDANNQNAAFEYLQRAHFLLDEHPEIQDILQGHFYKVTGKLRMESEPGSALGYFDAAAVKFGENQQEISDLNLYRGIASYYAGDFAAALEFFEVARFTFEQRHDKINLAQALNNIGVINLQMGNTTGATYFCQSALNLNQETGQVSNAERNRRNLELCDATRGGSYPALVKVENDSPNNGGGTGGSTGDVKTSGGGTVVVSGGGG